MKILTKPSKPDMNHIRVLADHLDKAYAFELLWPLFEQLDELICIADQSGYLIKVNQSWSRVLGWTKKELMSRPWLEFVHPDDRERTIQAAQQMENQPIMGFTNRYLTKDGSYEEIKWFTLKWNDAGFALCIAKYAPMH